MNARSAGGVVTCRWCGDPIGPRATTCSPAHRVYANRVDAAYRRGQLRACPWYGPDARYVRVEAVNGDGITTWHVVRMRQGLTA